MINNSFIALDVVLGAVGIYLVQHLLRKSSSLPLPPGPKGYPLIGNVPDMPKKQDWLTFAEWGRKWGGILSVNLLGRTMIIVNSATVMEELDKKGAIYSDRPRLEMGGELLGYANTLVLIPYGSRFRTYRKHFAKIIGGTGPVGQMHPMAIEETRKFLQRTLANPDGLMGHLRKLAGGVILRLTYGYTPVDTPNGDPFVNLIERANENFNVASVPGNFIVDFFPLLKDLPEWLPGTGFMQTAREWAKDTMAMVEVPFEWTKKNMETGTAPPSFVSTLLAEESSLTYDQLQDLKFTASSLYGGGADTTVSAEYAFFLAMVMFPDVQKKAQAELDAVVGKDRLPTFADQSNLPYINAVLTEVLRWNSVAPTGVPHTATEDGIVGGYFIPKGAIIITNLWNMLHDPATYPAPFEFDPSRYLGPNPQADPRSVCFGYGRRVCPGMYLAEATLYLTIAMSLAVFDISKAVVDGKEILPVHENTSGTISYPQPFKCAIKPRSEKAMALITAEH